MKKFILAALVALPLTALAGQRASAGGCGDCCTPLYRLGFSLGIVYRGWCGCDYSCCKQKHGHGGCGQQQCCNFPGGGPWYGAWPMGAHFNVPAPTGYPYWPAPMTWAGHAMAPMPMPMAPPAMASMPGMEYYGNAAASVPMGGNFGGYPMAVGVQPVGYMSQAPAYWQMGR